MTVREFTKRYNEEKVKHSTARYPVKESFSEKDTNSLTASVIAYSKYLNYKLGHDATFAYRVNNTGIYDAKIGGYRTGGGRKGQADVNFVFGGRILYLEIKKGKDRQSKDQKRFEDRADNAGAEYHLIKTFAQAVETINDFTS